MRLGLRAEGWHREHSAAPRISTAARRAAIGPAGERPGRGRPGSRRGQPRGRRVLHLVPSWPAGRPGRSGPRRHCRHPRTGEGRDEPRTGHRRDRVRRLGAGHRHRVRGPLRHVRGAQHERLHHVRQLHRHGRAVIQSFSRGRLHGGPSYCPAGQSARPYIYASPRLVANVLICRGQGQELRAQRDLGHVTYQSAAADGS
jgi:hypothetical protein